MTEISRLRSVIDRMEAEGWEPRYSAVTIGAMQQWRIDWTRTARATSAKKVDMTIGGYPS